MVVLLIGAASSASDQLMSHIRSTGVEVIEFSDGSAALRWLQTSGLASGKSNEIRAGDLVLDLVERRATYRESRVTLTRQEFTILALLAADFCSTVPRSRLTEMLWGSSRGIDFARLRTAVSRLRGRLLENHVLMDIQTEHALGYRLVETRHRASELVPYMLDHRLHLTPPTETQQVVPN